MPVTTSTYEVRNDDDVTITVVIGEAQPGSSVVFLGTEIVAEGDETIKKAALGTGRDVRGHKVVASSTTKNVNASANKRTSVKVTLAGGADPKEILQRQNAKKKGEMISYVTVITFI